MSIKHNSNGSSMPFKFSMVKMMTLAVALVMMLGINTVSADSMISPTLEQHRRDQVKAFKKYQLKKPKHLQRVIVQADTDQEVINYNDPQTYNDYFALVDAFNDGAKIETFYPFAPLCTDSLRDLLNDWNGTNQNMSDDAWSTDTYNTLRNYSSLFSNQFADAYLNCHLTVVDVYDYKQEQDAKFPNGTEAFQAFLQNVAGQIITLNNIYARIVTATDNNDQKLIVFLTGRIFYLLAKFEPIEASSFTNEERRALKIFEFAENTLHMQAQINAGNIPLEDQKKAAEQDKRDMANREAEMKEYIQNFYEQEQKTPSFDTILKAYADYYNKSHPMVGSDGTDHNPYADLLLEYEEKSSWEKTVLWTEYGGVFVLEAQDATIGAVSGNLSNCQNNATAVNGKLKKIGGEYQTEKYAQAGYTTHEVLSTADPIIFSCFFSLFEYSDALSSYIETMKSPSKLSYNLAHNLGNIYDLTEEAIKRSVDWSKGVWLTRQYWARMGYIAGSNFQNLFEDPENYYYVDPATIDTIDRPL